MKRLLQIVFFLFTISAFPQLLSAATGTDCSTAITVSANGCSAAGAYNNTGITGTLSAPSCFGTGNNNGMWFQFVASSTTVTASAVGSTLTQPMIALLSPATAPCTGPFTELSCNNSGTATSSLTYSNLTAGKTYYLYVDGANNLTGTFQLCLTSPVIPPNDDPCSAIYIVGKFHNVHRCVCRVQSFMYQAVFQGIYTVQPVHFITQVCVLIQQAVIHLSKPEVIDHIALLFVNYAGYGISGADNIIAL